MSSSSFSQGGEQSVLGTEGGLGGQVGGDTTDIDIEAPGMEAVMDDLALPAQHSSTSDGSATRPSPTRGDSARRGNGGAGGGNSTSGTSANSPATGSSAAGLNAAVAAGASRAAGSPEGSPPSSRSSSSDSSVSFGLKRQRKSSMWRRSGSGNNRVAADLEEYGGAVVGKDGRRRSSGSRRRRSSGEGSGRRGSNGLLDRINDSVRSVAPAVKRRSSSIIKHVSAAASAAAAAAGMEGNGETDTASASDAVSGVTTVAGEAGGAARRASLLSVAMRSKTAAAAVEGANYEEEMNAEADVQAMERVMSIWNLEFDDPVLEKSFRRHYRSWVIPRIRIGVQIQMALILLFGSLELIFGYTAGAVMPILFLRLAIMLSLTTFSWMTLGKKFHKIMDPVALAFYTLNSILLVVTDVVGSAWGTETTSDGASLYYFFEGRWSLPSSLMFVVVVYHISGLRYMYSNIVAWSHYFFLWVGMVGGFCCREHTFGSFFTQSAVLVPIVVVLSMISSNTVERQIRGDFVLRCNISSERARADEICASMLPPRVSEMLKNGSAVQEVLQECPQITILFCYITGFKELTTSCDPYDVVDFVNSLFSSFDKCTEYHHVYKLEAIDCSYLCCAGGGQEGEQDNLAPAADRIWDMALTMLAVAAHGSKLPAQVGATGHGGGAVLKIGVHTGRAVGGVSGVKSYSYHLFGDTVNMASRTASTGLPGRVQLSRAAYKSLSPEKQSECELRIGVAMKGKGLIDTHLASFDPDGLGKRLWRNFRRFEKMTKVYDPNFQNMGTKDTGNGGKKDQEGGGTAAAASAASGVDAQQGKLEMIRVKRLKFTLKGSNYEDAQQAGLSDGLEAEYQHEYNASRLHHFQIVLFVAFLCISGSALLDYFGNPRHAPPGRSRIGMRVYVCALLLVVLVTTREPKLVNCIQVSGALVAVVFCITLNALLLVVPEYHMMDMNIISLITISLLMDLQYTYVLVVNVLDVIVYTIGINITNAHKGKDVAGYLLFVYGAALIGSYACNKREREFRYTFLHKRILKDNKVKAEDLLKNMFPNLTHVRTLVRGRRVVDHLEDVTIMFSDLKGYTQWASEESPKEVYRVLNKVYTAFDRHLDSLGVYKLDTVGDAFVVVAGLEGFKSKEDHAMAMVKYAFRMLFELERIKTEEDLKFEMRIGLHTGPCIGGVIGRLKPRYLCWGRTPLISNELEAAGTPGSLLVSSATFAQLNKQVLVTRGLKFRPGEPLHVKTFDDMADEEVPTFYIEMDSITAFTILANEIAEDRGTMRNPAGSAFDMDAADSPGMGEDWKSAMLGVTRLKHLFRKKAHDEQEAGTSLLDFSSTSAGGAWNKGGRTRGGGGRASRSPNNLGPSGLTMRTQSAYMASPPMSPESQQGLTSPAMWDGNEPQTPVSNIPLPLGASLQVTPGGGGGASAASGPQVAGEGKAGDPQLAGRARRASSVRPDGKRDRQRRPSSFHVIPGVTRASLERSVVEAAAVATAAAAEAENPKAPSEPKPSETSQEATRPGGNKDGVIEPRGNDPAVRGNLSGRKDSGNGGGGGRGEAGQRSRGGEGTPRANAEKDEEVSRRTGTGSSSSRGGGSDKRTSEENNSDTAATTHADGDDGGGGGSGWEDEGDDEPRIRKGSSTAWTSNDLRASVPSINKDSGWADEGGRSTSDSAGGSGGGSGDGSIAGQGESREAREAALRLLFSESQSDSDPALVDSVKSER